MASVWFNSASVNRKEEVEIRRFGCGKPNSVRRLTTVCVKSVSSSPITQS